MFEQWLNQFLNFEKLPQKNIFWLDTMAFLSEKLNNPEKSYPTIHIAGSKGKGSISAMISSILTEAGFSTGLYTSPHIINFHERISNNQKLFSSEIYENAATMIKNVINNNINSITKERPITWFELVTLYSFVCFKLAKVDYGIFEVGLGGRLDATNIIKPELCCISTIELEHTEFLGNTLEKIATEKAGIIKENTPVIVARQPESVKEVFRKIANEKNAPIYFIDEVFNEIKSEYSVLNCSENHTPTFSISLKSDIFDSPIITNMKLLGDFQAENAAIAAFAVKKLIPTISNKIIEQGLLKAKLPGRFEIINLEQSNKKLPTIILDGAHTVNSVKHTLKTFKQYFNSEESVLLFACAADKDVNEISKAFNNNLKVYLTIPGNIKQSNLKKLEEAFNKQKIKFNSDEDFKKQIELAISEAKNKRLPLLVTGSFYLVSEVKKYIDSL